LRRADEDEANDGEYSLEGAVEQATDAASTGFTGYGR
jgi:hypothetical protein